MHTYFHYIFKIDDVIFLDLKEDELTNNLKNMLIGEEFLVYPYRSSEKINMQSVYSALVDFYFRYLKKNKLDRNKTNINMQIDLDDKDEVFSKDKEYTFNVDICDKSMNNEINRIIKIKFVCFGRVAR